MKDATAGTLPPLRLFHYWRSSASWRVRWGLNIKGLTPEFVPVGLLDGEVDGPAHHARNPMAFVPVLEFLDYGSRTRVERPFRYMSESLPILEWLDETCPGPKLLPTDPWLRYRTRHLAEIINAGTQPLQNLEAQALAADTPEKRKTWTIHWIDKGLNAYEELVTETAGKFSLGDVPTLADLCLIPQVYNALRNDLNLGAWPTVKRIYETALQLPQCLASAPEQHAPPVG